MIKIKKDNFKELYDIACENWKSKFDELFKNSLFSDTLEFKEEFTEEMKKACNKDQLKVFLKVFKDYKSDDIFSVNTYSKICKELKEEEYTENHVSGLPKEYKKKQLAFLKLQQISKFFNKNWTPDFSNKSEYKYYPYFEYKASGLVFSSSGCSSYCFSVQVAFYKTEEISNFVGKTFIDIYEDLI